MQPRFALEATLLKTLQNGGNGGQDWTAMMISENPAKKLQHRKQKIKKKVGEEAQIQRIECKLII